MHCDHPHADPGSTATTRTRHDRGVAQQTDGAPAEQAPNGPARPERAIFRMPQVAILAALFAMICATPFAWAAPGLLAVYLLPIAFIVWVVRTRTTADTAGLEVRTALGGRKLAWAELKGLSITERAKIRAVLTDGTEVPLPFVRPRHLSVLALVSGGRITDPMAAPKVTEHADQDGAEQQSPDADA